jgi:hypothetical protein
MAEPADVHAHVAAGSAVASYAPTLDPDLGTLDLV